MRVVRSAGTVIGVGTAAARLIARARAHTHTHTRTRTNIHTDRHTQTHTRLLGVLVNHLNAIVIIYQKHTLTRVLLLPPVSHNTVAASAMQLAAEPDGSAGCCAA